MDGWTDVYTDPKGMKRCSRCHHLRTTQPPKDLSESTRQPMNEHTRAQRVMALQQKAELEAIETRRQQQAYSEAQM